MAGIRQRIVAFLLGQDESLNGLGGGSAKQTISGTLGRGRARGQWFGFLADVLDFVVEKVFGQQGHCSRAAASEANITP